MRLQQQQVCEQEKQNLQKERRKKNNRRRGGKHGRHKRAMARAANAGGQQNVHSEINTEVASVATTDVAMDDLDDILNDL